MRLVPQGNNFQILFFGDTDMSEKTIQTDTEQRTNQMDDGRVINIECYYNCRCKITSVRSLKEMYDIRNECLRIWKEEGSVRWHFLAKYADTGEHIKIANEFSR